LGAAAEALRTAQVDDGNSEVVRLIREAKAGSHDAFDLLIRRYQRRVLKVAYQYVGSVDDAQDVAQEVFVRLFKYLGRIRDERKFETWLYRLAVNASYDHLSRRSHRRDVVPIEDSEGREMALPDDRQIPSDRQAEGRQLKDRILASLDRLTPSEKAVFVLKDLNGKEVAEIADIKGISRITVRRHLSTARQKMRAMLAELDPSLAQREGGGR